MKKFLGALSAIVGMFLVMVSLVMGAEETATATVTINTFVDISLTQCPGTGDFNFGSHDPGETTDTPIACQDDIGTNGALRLTVEDTTNTPVDVDIKGTDYIGSVSGSIPVGNTEYEANAPKSGSAVALTTSYVQVWASMGGAGSTVYDDLWFWLDVPATFLTAGDYTSTYTISAS